MNSLLERFALSSTPAWRVLLAVFFAAPFFVAILVAHGWALATPAVSSALRTPFMWGLQALVLVASVVTWVVAWRLWPVRHQRDPVPTETLLVCQSIGLTYTWITVLAGTFTSSTNLVLMAVLVVGLLLFERKPMVWTYATCVAVLSAYDLGVLAGWVPYAPALRPEVLDAGKPVWWFAWWRQGVVTAGYAVPLVLLLVLFDRLDDLHQRLSHLSYTDGLTGLANRRRFMEALQAELARRDRSGEPLSLIFIDADHFKQVNDTHGHGVGDEVLRTLANWMMTQVRSPTDTACRIGGEEFALILPDTRLEQAQRIGERLGAQCRQHAFVGAHGAFCLSLSMGVVEGRRGQDLPTLMRLADEQLYRAKATGRDRVCVPDVAAEGA